MDQDRDVFSGLLQTLYAGLLEEDPWSAFLRALAKATDSTFAILLLTSSGRQAPAALIAPGADTRLTRDYFSGSYTDDPFVGLPEGQVIAFDDFVVPERISAAFRAYLTLSGGTQILGIDIHSADRAEARFRLTRSGKGPPAHPYTAQTKALLEALVPHLRIALSLSSRIESHASVQGVYRVAIERMAMGSFLLAKDGQMLRTNAVGQEMLDRKGPLRLSGGRLIVEPPAAARKLHALLSDPPEPGTTTHIPIGGADHGPEMAALAQNMPAPTFTASDKPVLALFVSDPSHSGSVTPEALRDLFQLTGQEATLAAAIGRGTALADAAQEMGIAYNTARAHLRMIFAKTGARRQNQLVHLIQSLAGIVGTPTTRA